MKQNPKPQLGLHLSHILCSWEPQPTTAATGQHFRAGAAAQSKESHRVSWSQGHLPVTVQPGSQEREAQRELQGTSLAQVPGTRNGGPGGEDSDSLALLLSEQLLGTNPHCLHRTCPQGPRSPSSFGVTTHLQAPHAREPLPAPFHLPNALMPGAKHRQRVTEEKQLVFLSYRFLCLGGRQPSGQQSSVCTAPA